MWKKSLCGRDICTSMSIAALFTIVKTLKQSNCPSCGVYIQLNIIQPWKQGSPATFDNMDQPSGHYAEWNESDKDRQILYDLTYMFSSVQSLSRVWLFATLWTAARQASLSITNSRSPPKPMSIESVMPPGHLILCHPFLLLSSIFSSIRVFSNESVLRIRWPKYGSFSFSISPSSEYPGLISFRMD